MLKNRLLNNSFSGILLFVSNLIIIFLLSPIIVRQLGNLNYGIWDLLLSLCGYLGLLEVGVGPAIIRYISRADALSNKYEMHRVFNNALLSLSALGTLSLLIMIFIAWNPEYIFNTSVRETPYLSLICFLAGLNLMIQFPGTVFVAYLMGLQQHYLVNYSRFCLAIISGILTYFALVNSAGLGLIWLSLIMLFINLLQYLFYFVLAKKNIGNLETKDHLFSFKIVKDLYFFGSKSFLIMLADRMERLSVPFVIGHTLGVAYIVHFSISARLYEYALNLINVVGFPLSPFFSSIEARDGKESMAELWLDSNRYLQIIVFGMAVGLGVLGYDFIKLWMGIQYAEEGRWVINFLAISLFINGLAPNSSRLLVALDKHGSLSIFLSIISLFTLSLSLIFVKFWGIPGIAFSLMIGSMVGFFFAWNGACEYLELSLIKQLLQNIKFLGIPVVLFFLVLNLLDVFNGSLSYFKLIINIGIGSFCYLITIYFIALKTEEKKLLSSALIRIKNRYMKNWV